MMNQKGRSDLPEYRANATFLFDDVYKNSTRGEKKQANVRHSGRSMIEMLGVLAIIGVLSVGGIAGYNKAMFKYRMNQTIQTVTQAMQNLVELSGKDWGDIETDRELTVKYGFLPASMCPADYVGANGDDTWWACKLPLGEIDIDLMQTQGKKFQGEFVIRFFEGNILQSCVEFLSYGWEKLYPQGWLTYDDDFHGSAIWVRADAEIHTLWSVNPDFYNGSKTDNITLSDIQNACDTCKGHPYCEVYMVFNSEL